ncbi:hypothetical protein MH215_17475 [Paenibacillus sp. ACRSA]|nr:hypothetical protein [Paenibacillus sp. ACRSA]MCG7378803.1 hypothetical protein [Paenibacillus sp. ACRSA]
MNETKKYIRIAEEKGTSLNYVEAVGQDHGMKQKYYMTEYIDWFKRFFK